MRTLFLASIALVSGALSMSVGCGSTANGSGGDAGSAGSGATAGSGGTGGSGGSACVPAEELCDGLDNSCDGQVDEGCDCKEGDTQPCYSGDPASQGIGACKDGTQTCDANGSWGACAGEVLPSPEQCNTVDDDCNGAADDMGTASCGIGACTATVDKCVDGALQTCVPGTPTTELCDGLDNNCNQLVDESFPEQNGACDTGQPGVCQGGTYACLAAGGGVAPVCVANQLPSTEACDGLDNDCNGLADDAIPGTGDACDTGQPGVCAAGTVSCQGGSVDCYSDTPASPEVCDGLDNDCNGTPDDPPGAGQTCSTGLLGACAAGIQGCQNGVLGCVQQIQAQVMDTCGDAVDNDCDGQVDEGCLFQFSGILTNIPVATLTGWQQCYLDTYAHNATPLAAILAQCSKPKLLLACRVTGSSTLTVAANAPRTDVIFDTGSTNILHVANNVGWYYNNDFSWGFAPANETVQRSPCDTNTANGDKRLCWHTSLGNIETGWRCGVTTGLNFIATHERIVYQAN